MITPLLAIVLSVSTHTPTPDRYAHGEGFLPMDTLRQFPSELKGMITGTFVRGYRVDFNGDGKKDYICWMADEKHTREYWITHEHKLTKTIAKYGQDYDFLWLINLDDDPEAEILRAIGYEDGIDYTLLDPDPGGATENLICYFNPVIIDSNAYFWGYPWDILEIITFQANDVVFIQATLEHDIQRDGLGVIPTAPAKFPAIFFIGRTTQPAMNVKGIRKIGWLSMNDLKEK